MINLGDASKPTVSSPVFESEEQTALSNEDDWRSDLQRCQHKRDRGPTNNREPLGYHSSNHGSVPSIRTTEMRRYNNNSIFPSKLLQNLTHPVLAMLLYKGVSNQLQFTREDTSRAEEALEKLTQVRQQSHASKYYFLSPLLILGYFFFL